ncbi:uncharacterized protein LOC127249121 [Andrographis paniculata]|uniref:uncharacterized protein LOC127249121 n=1 Tax=Andrographis paniculata TaxID=175694 RepID=UPI0021E85893|nr:uncharacterized protein LOC127249121 [Andrographis paniculata]
MSFEDEDPRSLDNGSDNSDEVLLKKKICYSRVFLLSLSSLDICKKLPSGFDESLISEFEDASQRITDRPRFPGSFPLQGFRRNDYGSSPPTRSDAGSYSRGTYGKWENRSSGQSERDSDSQSDNSDSGRRLSHQTRRSWQSPEHDGLLGSGSFSRPSGYSTGITGPKLQTNEHNQLSRSNEPYHPPRPFKAVPHSRRDTDSYNDETFGSVDSTSTDRAEEEKRRRASFEVMRKEQQRSLQEKQKLTLDKHKAGVLSDLYEMVMDSKEEKGLLIRNNELIASAATSMSTTDSEKPSSTSQSPALRPLVPPGFKSNSLEKSSALKSQIYPTLTEVESLGKTVAGDGLGFVLGNVVQNATGVLEKQLSQEIGLVEGQPAEKTHHALLLNKGKIANFYGSFDEPNKIPYMEDQSGQLSGHLDSLATHNDSGIPKLNAGLLEDKTVANKSSTSILENIFGSTLSFHDDKFSLAETLDGKPKDPWFPSPAQSSKFAQWFSEEEPKGSNDISSARPNDLLSLIACSDKADEEPDQISANKKAEPFPSVLTCEDLEQSLLSEYSSNTTKLQSNFESRSSTGAYMEQPSTHVDDHASLRLLSMLQKNTSHGNLVINSGIETNSADKGLVLGEHDMAAAAAVNEPKGHEGIQFSHNLGKTLTLETLFGTAFMKELQSVEAPVSVKRDSSDSPRGDASESLGLAFPISDDGISFPTDRSGLQKSDYDHSMPLNDRKNIKLNEADNWLGISPPSVNTVAVPRHGRSEIFDDFQPPKEDNLISLSNINVSQVPAGNLINASQVSSDTPVNIAEKLAALVSVKDNWRMGGSDTLPLTLDSYNQIEPPENLQLQQSSSLFQPPQMTQVGPLYPHLEPHPSQLSSQMNMFSPEGIFNHESLPIQQFSSSMPRPPFQRPNVGIPGYDVLSQQSVIHQMQMPVHPPPHMLTDFPRGGPVPHHINQANGFIQEVNQMQGFPFGPQHQPNTGSRGILMPGNPPEAFQRLMEMELRAKSNQRHPFRPDPSQGVYGHEVDLGFQYR